MVTCGPREKPNIVTLAWVGTICSNPPMLSISIRPSRYSNELVKQEGEFAVNLPPVDLVRDTDYCGSVSGRKVDKFAKTGLTPVPAKAIGTIARNKERRTVSIRMLIPPRRKDDRQGTPPCLRATGKNPREPRCAGKGSDARRAEASVSEGDTRPRRNEADGPFPAQPGGTHDLADACFVARPRRCFASASPRPRS